MKPISTLISLPPIRASISPWVIFVNRADDNKPAQYVNANNSVNEIYAVVCNIG